MADLVVIIMILVITYISGSSIEKKHFKRIREREKNMVNQPYVVDQFRTEDLSSADRVELVHGSCVIAADRFKVFLGGLLSLFGGRLSAYESLTDRARREAILRMREQAANADMIVCTRIQFSELQSAQVEAIAYGTAIYLNRTDNNVTANTHGKVQGYSF